MSEPIRHVCLIGAGRLSLEVESYLMDLIAQGHPLQLAGYVDENKTRGEFGSSEILGGFEELGKLVESRKEDKFEYIIPVGDNSVRRKLADRAQSLGLPNLTAGGFRHPFSSMGQKVNVGEGTWFAPGTVVTTLANIGRHVIVNVGALVSHDCVIGDFVNLNPGVLVCGTVKIGAGCYLGAGATVINGINIGEGSVIGAGASVVRDIPANVTAVGVPAKIIKRHEA